MLFRLSGLLMLSDRLFCSLLVVCVLELLMDVMMVYGLFCFMLSMILFLFGSLFGMICIEMFWFDMCFICLRFCFRLCRFSSLLLFVGNVVFYVLCSCLLVKCMWWIIFGISENFRILVDRFCLGSSICVVMYLCVRIVCDRFLMRMLRFCFLMYWLV